MLYWLYWVYCLAFAFDFRGEEGGSAIQYLFLALSFGSGTVIAWAGRRHLMVAPTAWLSLVWWGFLILTPFVSVLMHVPLGNYVRCSLPILLCGLSLLVMQTMAACMVRPKMLLMPLVVSGCINIVWRAIHALVITGIPMDQIRYEMLSAAAPLFIAYMMVALFFRTDGIAWDAFIAGGITFGSLFISITRSYIATAGIAFLACLWVAYLGLRRGQWTVDALRVKFRQAAVLAALGVALIVIICVSNPATMERWFGRLFENAGTGVETSADVTLLTRRAEADAMYQILADRPHHYLFGMGLGAFYYWDESYLPELLLVYGSRDVLNTEPFFPGHSTWVYALFSSGYVGLIAYLVMFVGALFVGYRSIRLLSVSGEAPDAYVVLGFIVTLCYVSQSFTANPFMDRFAGLIIGLFVAFPQVFINAHYRSTAALLRREVYSDHSNGLMVSGHSQPKLS